LEAAVKRSILILSLSAMMLGAFAVPALGGDTVGLVDPATGEWYLRDGNTTQSFYYGNPGDVPFMGDWNCDAVATPGLFRQSDAFAYLRNSNSQGIADIRFYFGNPSDIPLAGDFNGDGCDTLSIYRPSEARFYIINKLGENEGGLGAAEYSFLFGNPGDKPVVGDWDGDGIDEIGLHRETTGFFYYRNTLTTGIADGQFYFGDPGDRFVAGDWSDAVFLAAAVPPDTPAIYRPGDATFYFRDSNTQGNATAILPFGQASFLPVSGDTGADPLAVHLPPRAPSPPNSTAFYCNNPFALDSSCQGNTDSASAASESWACYFASPDEWNCGGDIDRTDAAGELWGCRLGASKTDWACSGDIDKRRPGTETWSCAPTPGVGWGCSGNIDGRSAANEAWTCNMVVVGDQISWSCSGDVDRTSSVDENWRCDFTSDRDWTCTGSHSWNAPIVSSINGVASAGQFLAASTLNLDNPAQSELLRAVAAGFAQGDR
jgi:hypothetical protein